jgi:hypothetical protein
MREEAGRDLLLETRILPGWQNEKEFSMFRGMIERWDLGDEGKKVMLMMYMYHCTIMYTLNRCIL